MTLKKISKPWDYNVFISIIIIKIVCIHYLYIFIIIIIIAIIFISWSDLRAKSNMFKSPWLDMTGLDFESIVE